MRARGRIEQPAAGAEAPASAAARETAEAASGVLPEEVLADTNAPVAPGRPSCARLSELMLFAPHSVGLVDLERPEEPFVFAHRERREPALWRPGLHARAAIASLISPDTACVGCQCPAYF